MTSRAPDPLRAAAVRLAAEEGWSVVTPGLLASRAGVTPDVVLGRWPARSALAAEVVTTAHLLPAPADRGSLRADLVAVAEGLGRPLSATEEAVAALLGDRHCSPELTAALDRAPQALLGELAARALARDEPVRVTEPASRTLRALLAHRLATGPLPAACTEHLADEVLLPALLGPRLARV